MLKKYLFIFILSIVSQNIKCQTTLAPGDILFTGYNAVAISGTADIFTFVALVPISANTVIYFTERGYQGNGNWQGSGTTEGTIKWTSSSALSVGNEVQISGLTASVNGSTNGTVAIVLGGNAASGLSISNAGDQIIAFQGGAGNPSNAAAVMISGISWALSCGTTSVASWNGAGCSYGPQTSTIPPGLTGGVNAFLVGTAGSTPNNDQAKFNCTGSPYSTIASLKTAILTLSNWTLGGATGITTITLPPGCSYFSSCAGLTIPALSQTNVSCNGGFNGVASVIPANGGASPYTYNWTPGTPTGDGTTSVTGLAAGTWTCTVTDANSCATTQIFNITQPTAISVTPASQTDVACNGGATGAASINTPTGGEGGYTYNWTPGTPTGNGTTSVTGLTAGTWTCTVTDANNCTTTQTFNITQPTAISVTPASQTNVACNGGATGEASINAPIGGAGGYTYNWAPGTPTGDGTASVTGLTTGTWTCTVTDVNLCTATQTFTITQPTAISVTPASQTNNTCYGGSNGAASINTPTGGAGGYTYNWSPGTPTGDGTTSVTGLTAGTWTCTITDANSCTTTQIFNITQPSPIFMSTSGTINNLCYGGSTGGVNIFSVSGGTGAYSYNWTPGNPTGDGTASVSGLTAGTWTCTISDANNCTRVETFIIGQPSSPIPATSVIQNNVSCFGGNNGYIALDTPKVSTGFISNNSTSGQSFDVNLTSTKTITGFDLNMSSVGTAEVFFYYRSGTVVGNNNSSAGWILAGSGTITTNGSNNVSTFILTTPLTLPSGLYGFYLGTYSTTTFFRYSNGTTVGNDLATSPFGGIIIKEGFGRSGSITAGSEFTPATTSPRRFSGAIRHTGELTYLWSNAATTSSISSLPANSYSVTVTDALTGCSTSQNFTITQPAALNSNVSQSLGVLTADLSGSTYQWYTCSNTIISGATSQSYTPTIAGDYKVDISLAGCSVTSACATVTTLGNNEFDLTSNFEVYPNPSNGIFVINSKENVSVEIFDIIGKQIHTQKNHIGNSKIDLSNYQSGIYFLKITNDTNQTKTVKLVKQ